MACSSTRRDEADTKNLIIDAARGRQAADTLVRAFSTVGIHGRKEMPEDILPGEVVRGSNDHLLFITLTVAIDYQRDAPALWASARRTFEDHATQYLFHPRSLHEMAPRQIAEDMQRHGLSKRPQNDAWIWRTVGVTFYKKWAGDPRLFLADCGWDAPTVLQRLREDCHLYRGSPVRDYPFLRGPKIGPLWVRMLRDNVGLVELEHLDEVPIPADVHITRATLCLGIVRGEYQGPLSGLFRPVRRAWSCSVRGLRVRDRAMIALDVDEPLWHLSKYGCVTRDAVTGECRRSAACEARELCVPGRVRVEHSRTEVRT